MCTKVKLQGIYGERIDGIVGRYSNAHIVPEDFLYASMESFLGTYASNHLGEVIYNRPLSTNMFNVGIGVSGAKKSASDRLFDCYSRDFVIEEGDRIQKNKQLFIERKNILLDEIKTVAKKYNPSRIGISAFDDEESSLINQEKKKEEDWDTEDCLDIIRNYGNYKDEDCMKFVMYPRREMVTSDANLTGWIRSIKDNEEFAKLTRTISCGSMFHAPELQSWIAGLKKHNKNGENDEQLYIKGFDGDSAYTKTRMGEEYCAVIRSLRISIWGCSQPDVMRTTFPTQANGLRERFSFFYPELSERELYVTDEPKVAYDYEKNHFDADKNYIDGIVQRIVTRVPTMFTMSVDDYCEIISFIDSKWKPYIARGFSKTKVPSYVAKWVAIMGLIDNLKPNREDRDINGVTYKVVEVPSDYVKRLKSRIKYFLVMWLKTNDCLEKEDEDVTSTLIKKKLEEKGGMTKEKLRQSSKSFIKKGSNFRMVLQQMVTSGLLVVGEDEIISIVKEDGHV